MTKYYKTFYNLMVLNIQSLSDEHFPVIYLFFYNKLFYLEVKIRRIYGIK